MNNICVKTNTPPPKILRVVGKYRFLALVLALLLCSSLFGCSNSESEPFNNNDIYISRAVESAGYNADRYNIYFNYIYTQKNLLRATLIDTRISAELKYSSNHDYEILKSEFYIGGEERNFYNGNFLTPNMSITILLSFEMFEFENIKTLEIEIYHTENDQETTIAKKTFTQAELNKQLQKVLKGE